MAAVAAYKRSKKLSINEESRERHEFWLLK